MWQIRGNFVLAFIYPIISNISNMQAFWGVRTFRYSVAKGAVDRFRDLLKKQEHKLFITIFVNLSDNYDKNTIINFNNKFSKYTSNYTLLFISHIPDKEQNKHEFTYHDNIHYHKAMVQYFLIIMTIFIWII